MVTFHPKYLPLSALLCFWDMGILSCYLTSISSEY